MSEENRVMPQLDVPVCYTNVGHSKFRYMIFKTFIRSDRSAFEQAHCQVC